MHLPPSEDALTGRLPRETLTALAQAYGVATEYSDWRGEHVTVPEATVTTVLSALGVDVSTPESLHDALENRRLHHWRRMLPSCLVTREGGEPRVPVHVVDGAPLQAWVTLEDGSRRDVRQLDVWVDPVEVDGVRLGEATLALPPDLPLGWHRLHAVSDHREASMPLVVTPARLHLPAAVGERRAWGFMTQLYAMRSQTSWGLGDLGDLADLATWSGTELGAGFVLVNPLHAAQPVPPLEPSPYFPTTRRFANPVYLRVEDVPEVAALPDEDRVRVDALATALRVRNTTDDRLDRDAVWTAKRAALSLAFAAPRTPERQDAFAGYVAREGEGLVDFATWCALVEEHGLPASTWPDGLDDPASPETAAARDRLAIRVEFGCWLQFLVDEQLAAAQRAATAAGMPVGVVHDLAVGVSPEGSDAWALGDVLARGVSAGAPPDGFNQQGQDWRQPPWRPDRLAEVGYAPFRDMLRSVLRHAGGVRVDHVIGLFRLWWVPEGASPADGTYVRYDHEAMVGILALEAHRHGALVVGEDLGTVEPWARTYLAERGLAGTSILWFERNGEGGPLDPDQWRESCLATVTTHDLPPTAGYLAGEHVRIRAELGLLTRPVEEVWAADEAHRAAWVDALRLCGLLDEDASEQETVRALHAYLGRTPCRLLGVALPDAVGDRRPQNQPGTVDEYPNWRLPMADGQGRPVLLEDVKRGPGAAALARALGLSRGASSPGPDS
ncbi:MAG: 4-alpha-glucanotransferase [Actinomycetes bacterium]